MQTLRIFLASSAELKPDRVAFAEMIRLTNDQWVHRGVYLQLVVWEDFLDAMSRTRLQDEYNRAITGCDLFVMLFCTKVGPYTAEEFETAFKQFQATNKPFIFTYFKDEAITTGSATQRDLMSLWAFQEKLRTLGHFQTPYKNVDALQLHFTRQLDKLAASGFVEFKPEAEGAPTAVGHQATLQGSGAIAQGNRANAVAAGGAMVGGNNTGSINTGKRIDTGGGAYFAGPATAGRDVIGRDLITHGVPGSELEALFTALLSSLLAQAPAGEQAAATGKLQELKAEVSKGPQADDGRVARLLDSLVGLVPSAVSAVVAAFASPLLAGVAGPVTTYAIEKLKIK